MINKKTNVNLIYILISSLLVWAAFFLVWVYNREAAPDEGSMLAKVEFIIQVCTIFILAKNYKASKPNLSRENRNIFLFWLAINCWLLLVDFFFYIAAYLSKTYLQGLSDLSFIFYYAPCTIYAILTVIFLAFVIVKKMLLNKYATSNLLLLLLVSLIVFKLYLSSVHYAYPVLSFKNVLQIALLFTEFILFDICIIGMIYANTIEAFILLIGIISLVTGDFFLTYTYMSQTIARYFIIGEFLWCLGLVFLLVSAISIQFSKKYSIPDWFRSDNAIKSRVGFNVYITSIMSFIIIYYISYYLKLINHDFLVVFPILTMLYSVIVVMFSIFIGNKFEEPFHKLQKNTQIMLSTSDEKLNKYKFDIEEFDNLQTFLVEAVKAIKLKEESNQLYTTFGQLAAGAAHSLGSPIASLNGALFNLRKECSMEENIQIVEESAELIAVIAEDILERYRCITSPILSEPDKKSEDLNEPRYANIQTLIKKLVVLKTREWQNNPCQMKLISELKYPYFNFVPKKIKVILSDLLNNSYESFYSNERKINILLRSDHTSLKIVVQDSGCGFKTADIQLRLSGISTKHKGKGVGLLNAYEYTNSIGGSLVINPTCTSGAEITISLPQKKLPNWITQEVKFTTN